MNSAVAARRVIPAVLIGLLAARAAAQWTSDPNTNTPVATNSGDEGTPIVAAAPGGATWVCHTDNSAGAGYKYSVQLLDSAGVRQFPSSIVVSPNRTNTATFLMDMEVDGLGNAIIAFDNTGIYAQKVLPDGSLAWGPSGVFMTGSTGALGPRVCAMADGSAVVCWASGSINLNFQRVNSNGTLGAAWQLTETGRAQSPSDMVGTSAVGEFILLWVRAEGTNMVTSRKGLKIQKWDASNAQVWNGGTPLNVYTSSAAPSQGIQTSYFPRVLADGANGAIVAWYDTGATRNAWLQHVLANGTFQFAAAGLAVSVVSSATELRLSAAVTYHATPGEYTVAYERSTPSQSAFGISAQRITGAGSRLWGTGAGVELLPMTGNHSSFINCNSAPSAGGNEAIVTWLQYAGANGPMGVLSSRLHADGTAVWSPANIEAATNTVNKGRLGVVNSTGGDWLVAGWGHDTSGNQDVRAMRINADGTRGSSDPICDSVDFNNDTLFPDTLDIDDFLSVFAGGPCSNDPNCNDIDYNNDALFPDTLDIDAVLSVFAGGPCLI